MTKKYTLLLFTIILAFGTFLPQERGNASSGSVTISTDTVNVRSGPGLSYPNIFTVKRGEQYQIVKEKDDWIEIKLSLGQTGWVVNWLVTKDDESNSGTEETTTTEMGKVNADTINIREEPYVSSSIVGKLTNGTDVSIISKQNKWLKINFSGIKGWVRAEFIDTQSENDSQKESVTGATGTVTADSLTVRSDSSLNSSIVGTVSQDQQFTILDEKYNWVKIEYESGSFGWVSGLFLEKTTASTQEKQALKTTTVTILHNGTNIRKEADAQSEVVALGDEGDQFTVKSIVNDWYEIQLKNGTTGYVAGWIVSNNGSNPQIHKGGAESYLKNKTIILDPGHGGGDNGTTGTNGTLEKDLTLRTARLLYGKLRAAGANVYLTRDTDTFISLPSRVYAATANSADAFISLHYDSSLDRSSRGMTGYYFYDYQKGLADSLYTSTIAQTDLSGRGVRFGDFHVIRENSQKAALIELGYLSNPQEEMTLNSSVFQENAASGLYDGLARYFKNN
ncbi:SH3 domain-containing protein [Neobacillus drentensis]|uniref:SH3 domain-containing protein n=1 Tax=Neobacillus drentensis TaxID=220684 RepID=UPI003000A684